MSRTNKMTVLVGSFVVLTSGVLLGCGGGGAEASLIRTFFTAARYDDRVTLGNMAMVGFPPSERGIVRTFDVTMVSEEQVRPLRLRDLVRAVEEAEAADVEFRARKKMYQDENTEAIVRVLEAESDGEDVSSADEEIQDAWSQWRSEERQSATTVSAAQNELNEESQVAQASTFEPDNPIAVSDFEGEVFSKEVSIDASVEQDGSTEEQTINLTIQKVTLGSGDEMIDGRWIITGIN